MPSQFQPPAPSPQVGAAVRVWNYLGGDIHLDDRLAAAAELVGINDIELLIAQLGAIREHQQEAD